MSPLGEWIDLDIDLAKPQHEDGWTWNSGFAEAARVDSAGRTWYGAMRIPFSDSKAPLRGLEAVSNQSILQPGGHLNRMQVEWQPTRSRTFHVPERLACCS
jgi:hypothetical protein